MDQDDPLGSYRDKFHYPKNYKKEKVIECLGKKGITWSA